jgi:hypothetical protein
MNEALLARILEWEIQREERISERVDRHEWGRAFLSPTIPLVWDANWILIEQPGMAVDEIIEVADRSIGSAGMRHRTVLAPDAADGHRLVPEFEARGWGIEPGLHMVHRRAPDREAEVQVAECRMDDIEDLRRELIRRQLSEIGVRNQDVTEQLLEWERRLGVCDGDRWFVAPAGGRPASACRLLARDGIGRSKTWGRCPRRAARALRAQSRLQQHELRRTRETISLSWRRRPTIGRGCSTRSSGSMRSARCTRSGAGLDLRN